MTAKSPATLFDPETAPDDDIPDMSVAFWHDKFAAAPVQRGRPKLERTKVSTTLRLDPDVVARFKADGPGWQGRMNAALRKAAGLGGI
jgi:uncharacterized protein (DUF4415 family)